MVGGDVPDGPGYEFKRLLERCLQQAGLTPRSLHLELRRHAPEDVHENTIASWLRPHATTGEPSLPVREATVRIVTQWLCAKAEVDVTEEALLSAWRSDIAARAARRRAAAAEEPTVPTQLRRGEVYEGIVDATIYLGMDTLLGRVDQRLRELLNTGQPIPTYFAYLTHRGYLNWVRLTEDSRYTYYRAGVELCEANAGTIAAEIVRSTGNGNIDVVSLGPGTGSKDRPLLHALAAAVEPLDGALCYYPYDINPAMIVHAIQTVRTGIAARVSVKGIIAPFDSLGLFSLVYRNRAGPNVLSLLGNTLGNMSDDGGFLETMFLNGMHPGDYLALEVRCQVGDGATAAPGIGDDAKKRFNFGPLEILGADYDDHRDFITIRRERARSVIPNTVTTVTRCERVRCGPMTWKDVRLAYVHEYCESDLDAVLTDIGYTVVSKFSAGAVTLLYLLQKP